MADVHEREYKRAGGSTLTGADDVVVMDMVTTYTNQDPAGDEYYATYYATGTDGVGDDQVGRRRRRTPYRSGPPFAGTDGALMLERGRSKLAKSSGFPSGENQLYTYDGGSSNRKVATGDDVLLGTFNGVPGKFSCSTQGVHRLDEQSRRPLAWLRRGGRLELVSGRSRRMAIRRRSWSRE